MGLIGLGEEGRRGRGLRKGRIGGAVLRVEVGCM